MKNAIRAPKIRIAILLSLISTTAFFLFHQFTKPWVLDYPTELPPNSPRRLGSATIAIRFSPDGKYLLVAGEITGSKSGHFGSDNGRSDFQMRDRRLRLFDVEKQKEIERLKAQPLFGGWNGDHMLITPDFKKLITTSHFENLKIIDVRKKSPDSSMEVQPHDSPYRETITSMKISPDGKVLALGTMGGAIFYDLHTFRKLKSYDHYGGNFGANVFFGRGSDVVMLVYPRSKRPHFVSVKTGKRVPTPRSIREFEVTNSPNGKYFAEIKNLNQLEIWKRGNGRSQKLKTWDCDLVEIQTVQFSPDNKMLAVGGSSSTENSVRFYKLADIRNARKPL